MPENAAPRDRKRQARPTAEERQAEIVSFLEQPASYGAPQPERVEHVTTHISHVFLAGPRAFKLKRAVKLSYVDFSSLAQRKAACDRELELNRRTAPELYKGVVPVTRDAGGHLRLGGTGKIVDWLVEMAAFDQSQTLDKLTARGALPSTLLLGLGDAIAAFHDTAEISYAFGGAEAIARVITGNERAFLACPEESFPPGQIRALTAESNRCLTAIAPLLDRRRDRGEVRRCHGDLHLGNLCLIDGRPTLFDCLEFDDALSTIDVLYDLAFLLMDLVHQHLGDEANLVFNRYLDRRPQTDGLAAMPLFLAIRAAIRAHVTALKGPAAIQSARTYAELACDFLKPRSPKLIAIGGLSGTGKSTLAYRLAPGIGAEPGARVIRSDVIRKRIFGVAPETRLDQEAYGQDATARVYRTMISDAAATLAAGHSVIVDAVFLRPGERRAIADAAREKAVPFAGFWLSAPTDMLEQRIAGRRNDASDADVSVLRRQVALDPGEISWQQIDVSSSPEHAVAAVQRALH